MTRLTMLLAAAGLAVAAGLPAQEGQGPGPFDHLAPDAKITANFRQEDLGAILEMFSSTYALNIVAGPEVQGTVSINLYEAPVQEALRQILAASSLTWDEQGRFLIIRPVREETALEPELDAASPFPPRVIFLDHVRARDVVPMIQPLLHGGERVLEGPASETGIDDLTKLGGNAQASQEMILLLASEESLARVEALLEQIDVPPPQVLVEATILQVTLSDNSKMGVDFTALGGVDFAAMGGTTDVTGGVTTDTVGGSQLNDWLLGAGTRDFTSPSSKGLHIGILRDQVGVFIEALEEVGNATVLSNPTVLAVNRHPAQVLVGRKLGYLILQQTETSTLQSVQFLEVGTSLVFRPYISDDGWIRLEIHPKSSDGQVSPSTGLPEESTTEVTANILVRSGNTVVIGGLMETSMITNLSQVPLLGSLPIVGALFRSEQELETRTEIIILLTPHIVGQDELARRADDARRRFESTLTELAASHNGYLRPAYARTMYASAAAALAAGDPEQALARAEWGLRAMPADPDLALLAGHCRREIEARRAEAVETRAAVELMDQLRSEEE